jgi:DNA-binding NarL/FixJ family response regulator
MSSTVGAEPIRVVLADDHDLVRSGIRSLVAHMDGMEVVGEARDGVELLARIQALRPSIVVTDISMPNMDGFAALDAIHTQFPEVKVLVLSMYDSVDYVKRAVASGACGYLMKDSHPSELEQALRSVAATGSYFSAAVARRLMERSPQDDADQLTDRQQQILKLIAQGMSAKEIAYELGLSPKTVDVHRARIMERLRLNDIASLTRYAVRRGLVKA